MSFLEAFAEDLPARVWPAARAGPGRPAPLREARSALLVERLYHWGLRRPDVEEARAGQGAEALPALAIAASAAAGPAESFLAGRHFAHFLPDGSVRLRLPAAAVEPVLARGWGEREPLAGEARPGNTLRLYAPRDEEELHAVALILDVARAFAAGEFPCDPSPL